MTICLCHGGICELSIRCSWPIHWWVNGWMGVWMEGAGDSVSLRGTGSRVRGAVAPRAGVHLRGRDLRGDPRGGKAGGWRRLPKRLGAAVVGCKCR